MGGFGSGRSGWRGKVEHNRSLDVSRLHRAGCWAEVASGFEYRVARRAGVPGSQIVFNGPYKTVLELRQALRENGVPQERFRVLDFGETLTASMPAAEDSPR